jgi:hypothetical protein
MINSLGLIHKLTPSSSTNELENMNFFSNIIKNHDLELYTTLTQSAQVNSASSDERVFSMTRFTEYLSSNIDDKLYQSKEAYMEYMSEQLEEELKYDLYSLFIRHAIVQKRLVWTHISTLRELKEKLKLETKICRDLSRQVYFNVNSKEFDIKVKSDDQKEHILIHTAKIMLRNDGMLSQNEKDFIEEKGKELFCNDKDYKTFEQFFSRSRLFQGDDEKGFLKEFSEDALSLGALTVLVTRADRKNHKAEERNLAKLSERYALKYDSNKIISLINAKSTQEIMKSIAPENQSFILFESLHMALSDNDISSEQEQLIIKDLIIAFFDNLDPTHEDYQQYLALHLLCFVDFIACYDKDKASNRIINIFAKKLVTVLNDPNSMNSWIIAVTRAIELLEKTRRKENLKLSSSFMVTQSEPKESHLREMLHDVFHNKMGANLLDIRNAKQLSKYPIAADLFNDMVIAELVCLLTPNDNRHLTQLRPLLDEIINQTLDEDMKLMAIESAVRAAYHDGTMCRAEEEFIESFNLDDEQFRYVKFLALTGV